MPDPAVQPSSLPVFRLFDEPFLRRLERLAVLSRQAMAGQTQGERRSPKRGQSVEFADFRPYAPGDDFRRIDWNAYARLERFFLKLFVEEEDLTVHLLVDVSRSMDWGEPNKLWYALRAAGALGYVALAGLDRVTVTALSGDRRPNGNAGYFPAHRGKQQASALFQFLAGLNAGGSTDLGRSLSRYAAAANQPGPLILLSDLFDSAPQSPHSAQGAGQSSSLPAAGLTALASRGFEVTLLHILAPDEANPDLAGDLKLRDLETGAEVEITADDDLLRRYREGLAAWQQDLRRFCGARGMHYVPVETTVPIEELLFAWLRRQGVLK
ncbi:MAG TPA: DUF58 domain-containing protein [Anaerolineae bacterium]|nr:DUF58 domain-containing protein [Anaerolineae bacterium]